MERWAVVGEPTASARLAQARAWVGLRLMDRAWALLKELTERGEGGVDAHLLTARMFIDRGWPTQARKALDRVSTDAPAHPELAALIARCEQPPARPSDVDPDTEADAAALLAGAERYLVEGAFLRARRILEHLKRQGTDSRRVGDLLWALDGDFALEDPELLEVVERASSELAGELTDEVEHTESVSRTSADRESDSGSFPSLFRQDQSDQQKTPHSLGEITQSTAMTQLESEPEESEDGQGDTQIARVIRREHGPEITATVGEIHQGGPAETSFDLAAFRRDMGMEIVDTPSPEVEEEDAELIVFVRREAVATEGQEDTGLGDSIDPDTTTSDTASLDRPEPAVEAAIAPELGAEPSSSSEPAPTSPPPAAAGEMPAPRSADAEGNTNWWLLTLGIVVVFLAGILIVTVLVQIVSTLHTGV